MEKGGRLVLAIIVGIAAYFFTFWVPGSFVPQGQYWIANLMAIAAGVLAGRYVWKHPPADGGGRMARALRSGLKYGGIAFALGFFGPMLLGGGNQGPLLGLFITGPLGFLCGAVWGYFRS